LSTSRVSQHTISREGTDGNCNRQMVQRRERLWLHHPPIIKASTCSSTAPGSPAVAFGRSLKAAGVPRRRRRARRVRTPRTGRRSMDSPKAGSRSDRSPDAAAFRAAPGGWRGPRRARGRCAFYVELVRACAVRSRGVDGRGCVDGGRMVSRLSGRGVRRDRASASPRRPAKSPLRSSMRDENGDMFVPTASSYGRQRRIIT
jgi:hypothetical protein